MYARLLRMSADDLDGLVDALRAVDPGFAQVVPHAPGDERDRAGLLRQYLRHLLKVPDDGDLPEYMRRRFVEVARDFGLGPDLDTYSDADLAEALIDVVLELTGDLDPRARKRTKRADDWDAFATYFRTLRDRDRRAAAIDELRAALGERAAASFDDENFNAYERDAARLAGGAAGVTTAAVLKSAMVVGVVGVAAPLASVAATGAAGAYLAGLRRGKARADDRAKRARLSTRVQTVMVIAVWITLNRNAERASAGPG
ncbi:hypothetical protein DSM112329_00182 [Paraconexibacter sp. AEG42_29]|uniref:hypothetical protein n=1 Tax=Paraconexibacter sp. AEG42_29 TaxID=2997339 RepID=UPI00339D71C4